MIKSCFIKLIPWGSAKMGSGTSWILLLWYRPEKWSSESSWRILVPPSLPTCIGSAWVAVVLELSGICLVGKGRLTVWSYGLFGVWGFLKGWFTKIINTNLDHSVVPLEGWFWQACSDLHPSSIYYGWTNLAVLVQPSFPILPSFLK